VTTGRAEHSSGRHSVITQHNAPDHLHTQALPWARQLLVLHALYSLNSSWLMCRDIQAGDHPGLLC
jgi:hypothetical protein